MSDPDKNNQAHRQNNTERYYLGSSYSIIFEVFFFCLVIIPIQVILIAFVVAGFIKSPWVFIGVIPIGIILLLLMTYSGGLRYEIANGNLLIKSGFVRRLIEEIPTDSILNIEISDQVKFEAQSNFWFNYQPDGYGGFYKVYNRNFKKKAVMVQINKAQHKYLLGARNPDTLKSQIEKILTIQKHHKN